MVLHMGETCLATKKLTTKKKEIVIKKDSDWGDTTLAFFASRFSPPESRSDLMNIIRAARELKPGPRKACVAIR